MYGRILLAYNGFTDGSSAARHAMELANFAGAELHILGIVATTTAVELARASGTAGVLDKKRKQIERAVQAAAQVLDDRGMTVAVAFAEGDPAVEIVAHAYRVEADLCVLAHPDRGFLARWLQSPAGAQLIAHLPCSLLIPRGGVANGPRPEREP